jgi:hypothetical protein
MKKKNLFLLAATLLYSYLFYEQWVGINFLLFTIALVAFVFATDTRLIKSKAVVISAVGALITGICVAWHGSPLSIFANIVSLCVFAGMVAVPRTTLVLTVGHALWSTLLAPLFMLADEFAKRRTAREAGRPRAANRFMHWVMVVLLPVLALLFFTLLYRVVNPVFNEYVSKIKIDIESLQWILFTIGGFILLYGFFFHRQVPFISKWDREAQNDLAPEADWPPVLRRFLTLPLEYRSGLAMVGLLNALLLVVNLLDLKFFYLGHQLPEGITYSDYLHEGVAALIFSIAIVIGIILVYFRGALNFRQPNSALRILVYIWIAQNVFMVLSTSWRNAIYIEEYGLTYRRIGVYFWLGLTVIGLVLTAFKVARRKSNWYLIRAGSWAFYAVLVSSCIISWPDLVAKYNVRRATHQNVPLDHEYLISLSYHVLPYLAEYDKNDMLKWRQSPISPELRQVYLASQNLVARNKKMDWQSWNYDRQKTAYTMDVWFKENAETIKLNTIDR